MSPITIDRRPTCPTCGHVVHVQSIDGGTSYYVPDERDAEAAARASLPEPLPQGDGLDVERLAEEMAALPWTGSYEGNDSELGHWLWLNREALTAVLAATPSRPAEERKPNREIADGDPSDGNYGGT